MSREGVCVSWEGDVIAAKEAIPEAGSGEHRTQQRSKKETPVLMAARGVILFP